MPSNTQTFDELRPKIEAALVQRIQSGIMNPADPQGFTLVGIVTLPIQRDLGTISLGGPTLPAVAIVGNSTGIIHTFALKSLLPDIIL